METLFEIIGEAIFELFAEIILQGIANLLSSLFHIFENNSKTKRLIKLILVYIFFVLVLGLLIFSLFTKKGLYIQVILIYFILMLFVYFFKFLNKNILQNKYHLWVRVITSILHYALAISIIVVTAINKVTASSVLIILFASLSILIFFILDMFRIKRASNEIKRNKRKQKVYEELIKTDVLDKLD